MEEAVGGTRAGRTVTEHAGRRTGGVWRPLFSIAGFFGVELTYGVTSGSLALLLTPVTWRPMSSPWVRPWWPPASWHGLISLSGRRAYGSYRAEIFAAGLAVLLMLGAATYVVIEAVGRLGESVEVDTGPMFVVGGLELRVNVIAMALL